MAGEVFLVWRPRHIWQWLLITHTHALITHTLLWPIAGDIKPPQKAMRAMELQMIAERKRRQKVIRSEGKLN